METILNGGGRMKSRFSKLIEKDGFYIILFICVCIVAITAVLVSRENLNEKDEDKLSKLEDFIIVDQEEEPSLEIAQIGEDTQIDEIIEEEEITEEEREDEIETMLEEEDEIEEDLELVIEKAEVVSQNIDENMILPVDGKIGTGFTTDSLIYSETLEEWTSHSGIDILAKEGTLVKAVKSGKITEVYKDDIWGIVVLIDHGDGVITKYASLDAEDIVKEGAIVNRGDIIGKVGRSATIEMMMEPHVHFEVIKDGLNVNPKDYIPSLSR